MIKALWKGKKIFTQGYPLTGAKTSGTAQVTVDLVKQGIKDTIDTLSVHLVGSIVTGAGALGTATGQENPQALINLSTLSSAPQAAGLIPINAVSARGMVADQAVINGAFDTGGAIANAASSTIPIDVWLHYRFKRDGVKKGIDYAHPMSKWNSDVLTLNLGTIDQLFFGAATTWDMTGVTVEVWADMDVDTNPDQIHAIEIFEQVFPITAANPAFLINTLPQGCFYDNLLFITEDQTNANANSSALSDGVVTNFAIEGGGRDWLPQGDTNATYVRQRYTKPAFFDPAGGSHGLTGLYVLPLRDGLWSRALDASATPIVIKLAVNAPAGGHTFNLRVVGRKLVPGGIKKTVSKAGGGKVSVGLPNA